MVVKLDKISQEAADNMTKKLGPQPHEINWPLSGSAEVSPPTLDNRESQLFDALATLCACKRYKDKHGKTAEYEQSKDRAWETAFEITGL